MRAERRLARRLDELGIDLVGAVCPAPGLVGTLAEHPVALLEPGEPDAVGHGHEPHLGHAPARGRPRARRREQVVALRDDERDVARDGDMRHGTRAQ